MRENADQNNSEYGQFLRSGADVYLSQTLKICDAKRNKRFHISLGYRRSGV